eukprot:TRINITY_DN33549_c0_g1_i1.p1 TRINITY_DN33549_c0_g1~~TRINITY_DN33549_c0_g1_i1.p1  ORF type:complete len:1133 (+),score=201.44 TRINITY_DN33549_c0_g1_i1:920-4318(+)
MAVKVLISRKLRPGALGETLTVLGELRAKAVGSSGYITGETLRGRDDPDKLVVISTWESAQAWDAWQQDQARQDAENRLQPLLAEPTQVEVFDFGGSGQDGGILGIGVPRHERKIGLQQAQGQAVRPVGRHRHNRRTHDPGGPGSVLQKRARRDRAPCPPENSGPAQTDNRGSPAGAGPGHLLLGGPQAAPDSGTGARQELPGDVRPAGPPAEPHGPALPGQPQPAPRADAPGRAGVHAHRLGHRLHPAPRRRGRGGGPGPGRPDHPGGQPHLQDPHQPLSVVQPRPHGGQCAHRAGHGPTVQDIHPQAAPQGGAGHLARSAGRYPARPLPGTGGARLHRRPRRVPRAGLQPRDLRPAQGDQDRGRDPPAHRGGGGPHLAQDRIGLTEKRGVLLPPKGQIIRRVQVAQGGGVGGLQAQRGGAGAHSGQAFPIGRVQQARGRTGQAHQIVTAVRAGAQHQGGPLQGGQSRGDLLPAQAGQIAAHQHRPGRAFIQSPAQGPEHALPQVARPLFGILQPVAQPGPCPGLVAAGVAQLQVIGGGPGLRPQPRGQGPAQAVLQGGRTRLAQGRDEPGLDLARYRQSGKEDYAGERFFHVPIVNQGLELVAEAGQGKTLPVQLTIAPAGAIFSQSHPLGGALAPRPVHSHPVFGPYRAGDAGNGRAVARALRDHGRHAHGSPGHARPLRLLPGPPDRPLLSGRGALRQPPPGPQPLPPARGRLGGHWPGAGRHPAPGFPSNGRAPIPGPGPGAALPDPRQPVDLETSLEAHSPCGALVRPGLPCAVAPLSSRTNRPNAQERDMSQQHKNNAPATGDKKAQVLGENKKGASKALALVLVLAAVVLAGGVAWWTMGGGEQPTANYPAASTAQSQTGEQVVALPVKLFADHKARHFEHRLAGGITVRFFVIKSSDGVIRAAYDACDVCWPSGKGYYQDGDVMVCANCGRRFPSVSVNEVKGGCNPAPLRRMVKGDEVIIRVADIADGRRYFDFSKKGQHHEPHRHRAAQLAAQEGQGRLCAGRPAHRGGHHGGPHGPGLGPDPRGEPQAGEVRGQHPHHPQERPAQPFLRRPEPGRLFFCHPGDQTSRPGEPEEHKERGQRGRGGPHGPGPGGGGLPAGALGRRRLARGAHPQALVEGARG